MTARAVEQRERWIDHTGTDDNAVVRKADEIVARWHDDEPMEVYVWELPSWARAGLHAGARVTVHGDGSIEIRDTGTGPSADVVPITSRRSRD